MPGKAHVQMFYDNDRPLDDTEQTFIFIAVTLQTKTPLICAVYARDASFTVNIPGFGDFFSGTTPTFHIPRIYGDFVIYRAYAVIRYSDPSRSAILANSLGG